MAKPKVVEKGISLLGPVAFYVGLLITLGTAFITPSGWLYVGLAVIGVIVGLLNVTAKETGPFLFASIAYIVAALGMASLIPLAGVAIPPELIRLATNITVLVGAGAMLIALKAIYEISKGK
ncbi:MAG: hypothetical protein QMD95_03400 [Candidatus Hodarchaeaceae archaeon]|nr:hypothetical protein [Candidatus Hodarchaeaceae archaeon]